MSFVKWCELCQAEGIRSPVCLFQINFTEAVQMCKRPECLDLVQAKSFQNLIVCRDILQPGQKNPIPETDTSSTTLTKPKKPKLDDLSKSVDDSLERFLASFDDEHHSQHSSKDCNNSVRLAPANMSLQDEKHEGFSEMNPHLKETPERNTPVVPAKEATTTTLAKAISAEPCNAKEETPLNNPGETVQGVINTSRDDCSGANPPNTLARELEEHSYTRPAKLESAQHTSHVMEYNASPQVRIISSSEGGGGISTPEVYASGVPNICDSFGSECNYEMDAISRQSNQEGRGESTFGSTGGEMRGESDIQYSSVQGQQTFDSSEACSNAGSIYSTDDTMSSCLRIAESMGCVGDTVVHSLKSCNNGEGPLGVNDHFIMEIGASVDVTNQSVDESSASSTVEPLGTHKKPLMELKAAENPSTEVLQNTRTNGEPVTSGRFAISEAANVPGPFSTGPNSDVTLTERCRRGRGSENLDPAKSAAEYKETSRTDKQANPKDNETSFVFTHVTGSVQLTNQQCISGMFQNRTVVDPLQRALSNGQVKTIIEYRTPEGFHYYKTVPVENGAGSSTKQESRPALKGELPEKPLPQRPSKSQQANRASSRSGPLVLNKLAMISSVLQNAKNPTPSNSSTEQDQTPSKSSTEQNQTPQTRKEKAPKKSFASPNRQRNVKKPDRSVPQKKKNTERQLPAYRVMEPSFPDFSLSQRSPVRSDDGSSSSKQSSGSDGMQGSRFSLLSEGSLGANVSSSTFVRMVKDKVRARTQSGSGFAGYHPVLAKKPPYVEEKKTSRRGKKRLADGSLGNLSQELDEIVSKVEKTHDRNQYDSVLAELFNIA